MTRVVRRLYRVALLLLPRPLRAKHGDAMETLFLDGVERARTRGRWAHAGAVAAGLWDAVRRGAYERARRGPSRTTPGSVVVGHETAARFSGRAREGAVAALAYDVRLALRGLVRAPSFTTLALLTLTLGVGANVALFSVLHGVVLRPLPFPEHRLVTHLAWDFGGVRRSGYMPAYKLQFWAEHTRAFSSMATWAHTVVRDAAGGELTVLRVGHTFLDVVGSTPRYGRGFTPEDDRPGAPDVAILSFGAWRSRFGGDPDLVGRTITLGDVPHTVVGILPADFAFPQEPDWRDVLVPLRLRADPTNEAEDWPVLARRARDVDEAFARADVARVSAEFAMEHPDLMNERDRGMVMASYQDLYVGDTARVLWVLMAATGLVLVIACANVAALVLARGTSRAGDMAVRSALGAGRARIARHVVAEGLLLSGAACLLGLALASVLVDVLLGLYPGALPRAAAVGLRGEVVAYAAVAALATGVGCGLVAAVPALRGTSGAALREAGRGSTRARGLRYLVLVVESAISMVLLVGAGLLVATLVEIHRVDPGFDVDGLLVGPLPSPPGGWETEEAALSVAERVRREISAVPGVTSVATASSYPLTRGLNIPVTVQGSPGDAGTVEWRSVSPGYLETLGVPLLRGRALGPGDVEGAPVVAVVNRSFEAHFFPGGSALGRRIDIGRYRERWLNPDFDVGGVEIVGVVADMREVDLTLEPRRTVLVSAGQQTPAWLVSPPVLLARAHTRTAQAGARAAVARLATGPSVPELRAMDRVVGASVAEERFNALLMASLAAVALALTAFGIYGVVSYTTRQRRREIGIRVALGAGRGTIARLVMRHGMAPVLVGLAIGVVSALWLARFMESLLWGVAATDAKTVVVVALQLAVVAAVSSWLPSREACRVEPNRALRSD